MTCSLAKLHLLARPHSSGTVNTVPHLCMPATPRPATRPCVAQSECNKPALDPDLKSVDRNFLSPPSSVLPLIWTVQVVVTPAATQFCFCTRHSFRDGGARGI